MTSSVFSASFPNTLTVRGIKVMLDLILVYLLQQWLLLIHVFCPDTVNTATNFKVSSFFAEFPLTDASPPGNASVYQCVSVNKLSGTVTVNRYFYISGLMNDLPRL